MGFAATLIPGLWASRQTVILGWRHWRQRRLRRAAQLASIEWQLCGRNKNRGLDTLAQPP
jgi:hypothetical protein